MSHQQRPRIAVCFFGITRALARTFPSIDEFILQPARRHGEVKVFGHLFDLDTIDNPRTGEFMEMPKDEHQLIPWDELQMEKPMGCLADWDFERIKSFGDTWRDDHKSVQNLVHQLHSLHQVTAMAEGFEPDLILFCRPDLRYLDSFEPCIQRALSDPKPTVYIPYWQWRGGANDRFAVTNDMALAKRYGQRIEQAMSYCASGDRPLHAEKFLGVALQGIRLKRFGVRAVRVRANGSEHPESFSFEQIERIHRLVHYSGWPKPIRSISHRGLRAVQRVARLSVRT